ncbi:MAG: SufE family protein [Chthoniobacteraceae bacterium]
MSLLEKQAALIARLLLIEDAHERLAAITARGKKWPAPADSERTDAALVPGCSSRVWLAGELIDGACRFRMDADSHLVKGLAALLCELYDGATPADAIAVEPELIAVLGLDRMLSPTRLHGMASIRASIRSFAEAHA